MESFKPWNETSYVDRFKDFCMVIYRYVTSFFFTNYYREFKYSRFEVEKNDLLGEKTAIPLFLSRVIQCINNHTSQYDKVYGKITINSAGSKIEVPLSSLSTYSQGTLNDPSLSDYNIDSIDIQLIKKSEHPGGPVIVEFLNHAYYLKCDGGWFSKKLPRKVELITPPSELYYSSHSADERIYNYFNQKVSS